MPEYPKELVEAVARSLYSASGMPKPRWEEIRRSLLDVYFRDARAALEAADKWRAEHAAAEVPAPIGELVTNVGKLRVGDRVSFLAGDRDKRFFGVVDTLGGFGASVRCDGVNPVGGTEPWGVNGRDVPRRCGWRDLRLVSRAPVEAAPEAKASAADAQVPAAKPEQLAREVLEGLAVELDRRAAYEHSTAAKCDASGDPMFAEHCRGAAYAYLAAARDARSMELEPADATPPGAADAQVPGLLEEAERLTRRVAELESDYRIQAYADRVREIEALKKRAHGAEGLLEETQAERDEWKARADDVQTQLSGLREYAASILATLAEARATIGEAWFHGNATIADAIRRKCMALESAIGKAPAEKAPALPYEEDAKLVEACCRAFWDVFDHFGDRAKADSCSEMRKLIRVVREYHQARAKAQAVAEPEPEVEQVTRVYATTVAEMLLSFAIAVDAYAGGSASAATLISSVKRDIARVLSGELKSWTNKSGEEPTT